MSATAEDRACQIVESHDVVLVGGTVWAFDVMRNGDVWPTVEVPGAEGRNVLETLTADDCEALGEVLLTVAKSARAAR